MADHTTPSDETKAAEAKEATERAGAGPIDEAAAARADDHRVDPDVAATEKAAYERGSKVEGEGELP